MNTSPAHADPDDLHRFWFGALDEDGFATASQRQRWFRGGARMDERVRERFADLPAAAAAGALDHWLGTPRGRLGWILACDQLPRHLYRGTAEAFAFDPLALAAARAGIAAGTDRALGCDERAFFYLPFEHSESVLDQHTAVGLFTALHDGAPAGRSPLTAGWLRHAREHRDLVLRFGRFPHRNGLLGRPSTPQELDYLADGHTFGQG
jgi:uncharacterized protein (DUF924 family)